ncbi:MAG: hypothetical protein JWO97_3887 [Acidobacteria bacterium]|nr:hypothetical protein [Acidobacteriota bacterium]
MRRRKARTILAIDPTTYGFAFVAFERGELLDWGHRYARRGDGSTLDFLDQLTESLAADTLVLEDADDPECARSDRVRKLLRRIATHAARRGIRVVTVSRADVRRDWRDRGLRTKEAVAEAIARDFDELAPYVPPRRKISQTEDRRVNLFDAASLALHGFRKDTP